MAKARGIVADEDEFKLSEPIETRTSMERASRTQGLERLSQFENNMKPNNGDRGLQETLSALSTIKKSKVEFLDSTDGIKLAYRCYSRNSDVRAIFSK